MAEHEITLRTVPEPGYYSPLYRWVCSCGSRGKGVHGFEGQADSAGREHVRAKSGDGRG